MWSFAHPNQGILWLEQEFPTVFDRARVSWINLLAHAVLIRVRGSDVSILCVLQSVCTACSRYHAANPHAESCLGSVCTVSRSALVGAAGSAYGNA